MKKIKVTKQSLGKPHLLQISNLKTDYFRQLFGVCYEEITKLDQEDYYH